MSDLQAQALKAVVNRPSLAVMAFGMVQITLGLYAAVFRHDDVPEWGVQIIMANLVVGTVVFAAGVVLMFYGTAKREARQEREERRRSHAPRIRISNRDREYMARFHNVHVDRAVAELVQNFDITEGEARCRLRIGHHQSLISIDKDTDLVNSAGDHTRFAP